MFLYCNKTAQEHQLYYKRNVLKVLSKIFVVIPIKSTQ